MGDQLKMTAFTHLTIEELDLRVQVTTGMKTQWILLGRPAGDDWYHHTQFTLQKNGMAVDSAGRSADDAIKKYI